jgi:hypothetical protein
MSKYIQACDVVSRSCLLFDKVNLELIDLVNHHYYDLQMYANFVFDIDNDPEPLSSTNNFIVKIANVKNEYESKESLPLFLNDNMDRLSQLINIISSKLTNDVISHQKYLENVVSMSIFGSGAASPTILMNIVKAINSTTYEHEQLYEPLIVKFIPLQFVHHYDYLPEDFKNKTDIYKYIEAPSMALYYKEAWMYCFTKNHIKKYTPGFTCIGECNIIDGLPVLGSQPLNDIKILNDNFKIDRQSRGKKVPYKKWFEILTNDKYSLQLRTAILNMKYGSFEMMKIDGTLDDLIDENKLDLSLIFEYLYSKVICAFIGRVIFTDDHFGNVAYRTVRHARHYHIKSKNIQYDFYMSDPNMIQFIDLERYVFNYGPFDIYTNSALKKVSDKDFNPNKFKLNDAFESIENTYKSNNYIFDKGISTLRNKKEVTSDNFIVSDEYYPMLDIINDSTFGYIDTFCVIMNKSLPNSYKTPPKNVRIEHYSIDLDDNSLRVITQGIVFKDASII